MERLQTIKNLNRTSKRNYKNERDYKTTEERKMT